LGMALKKKKKGDAEDDDEFFSAKEDNSKKKKIAKSSLKEVKPKPTPRPSLFAEVLPSEDDSDDKSEDSVKEDGSKSPKCASRKIFESQYGIESEGKQYAYLPKLMAVGSKVTFDKVQDTVRNPQAECLQHQVLQKMTERSIKNDYRSWGVHRKLCQLSTGGTIPPSEKRTYLPRGLK
ncbi:hypothetical protein PFISCL1PPCAC_4259, partial [Pristionchus fissidentatus]